MIAKTKILIIKLGYSETLDPEIDIVPSLGDVLRTTPLLWALKEKYPDSHISWAVSHQAAPLLQGNALVDRLLIWNEFLPFQLMREKFDILINLEKIPGICALSDTIDAWTRYGFRFDSIKGTYHAYEKGMVFIEYLKDKKIANGSKDYWQKILIEMIGVEWKQQEYMVGYKPKSREAYDVGLNHIAGSKWPTKVMSRKRWQELSRMLTSYGYKVSWQEGLDDICEYIEWLNSCRVVISHDSLGMHIALALKKRTIGLFGPTDPQEIYGYGYSRIIHSRQECSSKPCYSPSCLSGKNCMENTDLEDIARTAQELINEP